MIEIEVKTLSNQPAGTVLLDPGVFGRPENLSLIHEAVVMQRASMRQGSAHTKTKGEVSGGGKKPWKQKGTGRARHGSIRSPLWRGGGTTFGPIPRDYSFPFPKNKSRAALRSVLSSKVRSGDLVVVEDLSIDAPKTKNFARIIDRLGLSPNGRSSLLIVTSTPEPNLLRAAANLPGVSMQSPHQLNVYDILRYRKILLTKGEVSRIAEIWGGRS